MNDPRADSKSVPQMASEAPNVPVPVPAILVAALIVGVILDNLVRIGLVAGFPELLRGALAVALILFGARLSFQGLGALRASGTPFKPWKPTLALTTRGIFERTRNPMYQGLCIIAFGLAIALRSDWSILLLAVALAVVNQYVVPEEERYLERKFAGDYEVYAARVPRYRWLIWPAASERPAQNDWLIWVIVAATWLVGSYACIWLADQVIATIEGRGARTAALGRALVTDRASLAAAAKAAGLRRSSDVLGHADGIARLDEDKVRVVGWAAEVGGSEPLTVLVFIDGTKRAETTTRGTRVDVTRELKLSPQSARNVAFEAILSCRRGQRLNTVATTVGNKFVPLDQLTCP